LNLTQAVSLGSCTIHRSDNETDEQG